MTNENKKNVFLITPIDSEGSQIRNRVNQWMNLVYKKVFPTKDYNIIRADYISAPGHITDQIISNILDADIVVIDFTGKNPNVMYEAAIRHATRKPYLQIIPITENIPFDIQNIRMIRYDPENLQYTNELVKTLRKAKIDIEKENFEAPNIIPHKFNWDQITTNPEEFANAIVQKFQNFNQTKSKKGIERISDIWGTGHLFSTTLGREIVCPKCHTADIDYKYTNQNESVGITAIYGIKYRCNSCGTEFKT